VIDEDRFQDYGPAGSGAMRGLVFMMAISAPFWIALGLVLFHFLHTH
jgi:hypothetical protein